MNKTLKLKAKVNYGRTDIYPMCEISKTLAGLTKSGKSFTVADLINLKSAGYTFIWMAEDPVIPEEFKNDGGSK